MTRVQYLRDQAARAERLARGALDHLTIERLTTLSIEYRAMADMLELTPEIALAAERGTGMPH
jgi:hypothetical protein